MSNAAPAPATSNWRYQVLRSVGMWLTHLAAGLALLVVMLWLIPNFEEICIAKEWAIPQVTLKLFWESHVFVNYLWILSPIAAVIDLALLVVLNLAGNRWRIAAGLYHNVLLVTILLNISFAFMTTSIVYQTYLHPDSPAEVEAE